MTIVQPTSPLQLGQPYDLLLDIKVPGLQSVDIWQTTIREGSKDVMVLEHSTHPVLRGKNGETFVKITPMHLGTVIVELGGFFSGDLAILHEQMEVQVELPSVAPKVLQGAHGGPFGGSFPKISLELHRPWGYSLTPNVLYEGLDKPVLIDPPYVTFKITTTNNQEIISIDQSTGRITPIKGGHALVETFFAGLKAYTCVTVLDQVERTSKCEDLLPPGVKLPGQR